MIAPSLEQEPHYPVWVSLTRDSVKELNNANLSLLSGMQAEVYLITENRTPLSYLTKPLTDQFARAFR